MQRVRFGVLGAVTAWDHEGTALDLKGPKHRAVLARLLTARGRMVPVDVIVDDLWIDPPSGAAGAVRTFVAALRKALEPDRLPRTPPRMLITEGPGYAMRVDRAAVDAWEFEEVVASADAAPPAQAIEKLTVALAMWRGPAYADFADDDWARPDRARLEDRRLGAVEMLAELRISLGKNEAAVSDLDAHVAEHPWREHGWTLLALGLYRSGRQSDALSVLRHARELLSATWGIDPGSGITDLETDILRHAPSLRPEQTRPGDAFDRAAAAYDRSISPTSSVRLESAAGLLRALAVTGGEGLTAAREQRLGTILAAERLGDPELTARVIGAFDVPGIWTRSDDPDQAYAIAAAARRTLRALPPGRAGLRARLLATIAMELRGTQQHGADAHAAAALSLNLAREQQDPSLIAFALSGLFMQSFQRVGSASTRVAIGAELVEVAGTGTLVTFEILGRLVRMQALSALGEFDAAESEAAAAESLAQRYDRPGTAVFTTWFRAMRCAASGASFDVAHTAYVDAAQLLVGAGMPGVERGLLPLALLCLAVVHDRPIDDVDAHLDADYGPYLPWAKPHLLLAEGDREGATAALISASSPQPDMLAEALSALTVDAARKLGRPDLCIAAQERLRPAANEIAGAGSGMLTLGPVSAYL